MENMLFGGNLLWSGEVVLDGYILEIISDENIWVLGVSIQEPSA